MATRSKPGFLNRQVTDTRYFFLDLNPKPTEELVVVGGGWERCLPGYQVSRSDFAYLSVEYVLRGKGWFVAEGRRMELQAGSVYVYGPGLHHEIESDPDDCLAKYFFDFSGARGARLLEETQLSPGQCVQVSIPRRVMEICESLIQNGVTDTPFNRRICVALLELLILKCAENIRSSDGQQSRAYSTYLRCRQHLEEHFMEIRTLDELARRCHVEKPHLCRLFQRFDQDTAYHRLVRMRMSRAADLLSGGERLIKEVADELGYEDPYHFSRVFKRVFGLSPEHFIHRSARGMGDY